jgi:hypothetical protein
LLGAAALACALDLIPYVGHPIAVVALWLSLKVVTRTDFIEVRFTTAIAYALLLGVNLFLVGSLLGDLRISARSGGQPTPTVAPGDDESDDGGNQRSATAQAPGAAGAATAQPAVRTAGGPAAGPAAQFALKGISQLGNNSFAMIDTGVKTYTFAPGESMVVQTPDGKVNVRLEKIATNSVTLNVGGQQVVVSR